MEATAGARGPSRTYLPWASRAWGPSNGGPLVASSALLGLEATPFLLGLKVLALDDVATQILPFLIPAHLLPAVFHAPCPLLNDCRVVCLPLPAGSSQEKAGLAHLCRQPLHTKWGGNPACLACGKLSVWKGGCCVTR